MANDDDATAVAFSAYIQSSGLNILLRKPAPTLSAGGSRKNPYRPKARRAPRNLAVLVFNNPV
jgi:aromatic ring hydroxylase